MSNFPAVAEQLELLLRGVVDVHVRSELEERLTESKASGRPLRVKAGFDPTRPDLHMGHAVLMAKMRQFQDLGHTAVLLVGEFTAMVGDPSGQNDLRPRLLREDVQAAARTYTEQAFKVLRKDRTELRSNMEWLDTLSASAIVELMAKMTVSRMLERNDFSKRYQEQRPIYQHEFLYPLLQGYDSVALDNDIELGGSDQLFNLLVGRDLMPKYGKRPQIVMTTPLLEGTDAKFVEGRIVGKKMSKSTGNYIGMTDSPDEMFRKVMQVDDDVIFRYFDLLSTKRNQELDALKQARAAGENPMTIKAVFARELIARFHDETQAASAEAAFKRVYEADAIPADVQEFSVATEGTSLWIAKALSAAGMVKSTGEGKRMVEQGGVEVDQVRITDGQHQLTKGGRYLVKVGSKNRRFALIVVT
jgi:tyrosyl-tRNA synthetase